MRKEEEIRSKLEELENWGFWRKFQAGYDRYRAYKKALRWVLEEDKK